MQLESLLNPPPVASHDRDAPQPTFIKPCTAELESFLTCSLMLDSYQRVVGYKLAWSRLVHEESANVLSRLKALLSCAADSLNPPHSGWLMGKLLLFFDMSVEGLALEELQRLPPENVVLCMKPEDLMDSCIRQKLLALHRQGFGFMPIGGGAPSHEPEVCLILSHVDARGSDLGSSLRTGQHLAMPGQELITTCKVIYGESRGRAAQGPGLLVERIAATDLTCKAGLRQPEFVLILRMLQLIRRDGDLRSIEATLAHDDELTARLLRHLNSPGIGHGVRIHSLRQALAIFGCAPLYRWLSVLLVTSNRAAADFMAKKAITRGWFVQLMGQGVVPLHEADDLFLTGMFSLMDQLLGVSMEEVLDKVQLSEPVQLALLKREGLYGTLVALTETCETDGRHAAALSASILLSARKVNDAQLLALAWAQDAVTCR